MDKDEHGVARRAVLMSAGVGIGAGLASGLAPAQAQGATPAAAAGAEIWSHEYWADKGGTVGWAKPRKRHSRPKDGVASLAYAHVFAPRKNAWARR